MIFQGTNARYNKKFKIAIHWIARIEKGKIVEVWSVSDTQGMFEQLGFKTTPLMLIPQEFRQNNYLNVKLINI